jgi:hypothetical protein
VAPSSTTDAGRYERYFARVHHGDTKDVPPWWTAYCDEPSSHRLASFRKLFLQQPGPGLSEAVVQAFWTAFVAGLQGLEFIIPHRLVDAHDRISFLHRKPDIVAYHPTCLTDTPFGITLIAEMKASKEMGKVSEFTATEIGHLLGFCEDLLELQLGRPSLTAFLTDGRIIQFFKVMRKADTYTACCTSVFELESTSTATSGAGVGSYLLLKLLLCPPAKLDSPYRELKVDGRVVDLHEWLGSGASANVYRATFNDREMVAKLFHNQRHLDQEMSTLKKVAGHPQLTTLVPTLEAVTDSALLLSPVGVPFATTLMSLVKNRLRLPQLEDLQQLLHIIKTTAQALHMVHRDLSLANFFRRQSDGKVLRPSVFAVALTSLCPGVLERLGLCCRHWCLLLLLWCSPDCS